MLFKPMGKVFKCRSACFFMVVSTIRKRPLPASFLLIGLFGFAASLIYLYSGTLSLKWGGLFLIFSSILIAASLRSLEM